jgi:hypothetical protein
MLQLGSFDNGALKDSRFVPALRQTVDADGSCSDWALEPCSNVCKLRDSCITVKDGCATVSHRRIQLRTTNAHVCLVVNRDEHVTFRDISFEGMMSSAAHVLCNSCQCVLLHLLLCNQVEPDLLECLLFLRLIKPSCNNHPRGSVPLKAFSSTSAARTVEMHQTSLT